MSRMDEALARYDKYLDKVLRSRHSRRMYMQRVRKFLERRPRALDADPAELRTICEEYTSQLPFNSATDTPKAAVRHYWSMVAGKRWAMGIRIADFGPRPEIDEEAASFGAWLRSRGGLDESTVADKVDTVRRFLYSAFDGRPFSSAGVGASDVSRHLSVTMSGHSESTRRRFATEARSYAEYLRARGLPELAERLSTLPMRGGVVRRPLPSALSDGDYDALLAVPDKTTPRGLRDLALARCMGDLGLRRSDVARIDLDDVDWVAGTVSVRNSKSKSDRTVPLTEEVGAAIEAYVLSGRDNGSASRALFLPCGREQPGDRMSFDQVGNAVRLLAERAGIAGFDGAHSLRRAVATNMVCNEVPIKVVADVLGHESVTTTMGYLRVDAASLSQACGAWPEGGSL